MHAAKFAQLFGRPLKQFYHEQWGNALGLDIAGLSDFLEEKWPARKGESLKDLIVRIYGTDAANMIEELI